MLDSLELFLIGFACVIDTVLLLVVCERINRSQVANWLILMIAGTWLVHASSFFHLMLREVESTPGEWLDRMSLVVMALGFMILPSAMLHGAIRLNHTGSTPHPPFDSRYAYLYLPLLVVPAVALLVLTSIERDFLTAIWPIDQFYLVWMLVANVGSIYLFLRVRRQISASGAFKFFTRLAVAIAITTAWALVYLVYARTTDWEVSVRLVTMLSPLIPAFLFLWHILRQRLIPLVIERTFVYGGILAILLLLHRVTITPWASALGERSNLDLVLIEWILLFSLVMIWRPLRERVRRSLRYLLSSDVTYIRDATRQISVQLSQQLSRSPDDLAEWFSTVVQEKLAVEFVTIELLGSLASEGRKAEKAGNVGNVGSFEWQRSKNLRCLFDALRGQTNGFISRDELSEASVSRAMEQLNADLAFRVAFRSIDGLAVLGPRLRSDRLADEQLTALAMLCDQLAATLFNREAEMHRLRAERQSMQQEKLAVLGLIAGSLAHEIRNPLSSIRTIATLMKEDMPDQGEHVGDISMIISEIDRLSQTTQRLLDYSKPSGAHEQETVPQRVVDRLLHILEYLARQHSVRMICKLDCDGAVVATSDATVSEIAFNLIRNAVEAAAEVPNGQVEITTFVEEGFWVLAVSDSGRGIDAAIREQIFQPFVTGKPNGTGLGLFVVSERVRELSGTLECRSQLDHGSTFEVRLPIAKRSESLSTT